MSKRRPFIAASNRGLARCEANVTLRDKSGAACMRRTVEGSKYCWQHQPKPEPPMTENEDEMFGRYDAVELIEQAHGEAWVSYGTVHGYTIGYVNWNGERVLLARSPKSWREACQKAGLIPND